MLRTCVTPLPVPESAGACSATNNVNPRVHLQSPLHHTPHFSDAGPTMVTDAEEFRKGDMVEVSIEEEGLRGSWYTATVLRPVTKKSKKIYVEFHTLMEEGDESKPLRESVDAILVRPYAPREVVRSFKLMEEVDAFYNDGWWEGVVTKVQENSRYSVFFRTSREQIDFNQGDLRLHREWVRGNWVPPLEESQS